LLISKINRMAEKGKTNNPNGRPKGALSVKTKAWDQLGEFFTTSGAEKAMDIINYYGEIVVKEDGSKDYRNPDKFLLHYTNIMEYFKPKQSRVEAMVKSEEVTKITFVHASKDNSNK
jgi:hypothetical protein